MPMRDQVALTFAAADISPQRDMLTGATRSAERVSLAPTPFEYATTGDAHYLALHDIVMRDGELRVASAAPVRQTDLRRKLTFLPAGVPVIGWTDPLERPNSFVAVHFDAQAIPEALRESRSFQDPAIYFQDRFLFDTLSRLERAMVRDEPHIELLSESLCDVAIIAYGLRRDKAQDVGRRTRRLPPSEVAKVRAFIMTNLATPLSLSALSQTIGLSKFHFSRAFKAATGRSPYREVLDTRLGVARRLLGEGGSLREAAAQTGFNSATQLVRSLRENPTPAASEADGGQRPHD